MDIYLKNSFSYADITIVKGYDIPLTKIQLGFEFSLNPLSCLTTLKSCDTKERSVGG